MKITLHPNLHRTDPSEHARRSARHGRATRAVIIVMTVIVALGAAWMWMRPTSTKAAVEYETGLVTRGEVSSHVTATGTLNAVTALEVGSQVSGIIRHLYVDYNSPVKKGQALAQLDQATFQAQVDQAEAAVSNAEAAFQNARAAEKDTSAGITSAGASVLSFQAKAASARAAVANANAGLRAAQANLQKAQSDLHQAEINHSRNKTLLAKDLIPRSDYDTTSTQLTNARAAVGAARGQVDAAQATARAAEFTARSAEMEIETARMRQQSAMAQHEQSLASMRAAEAQMRAQKALLTQHRTTLSYTTIRSPIDGVVVDRKVQIGQTVAANFQAPDLFSLAEDLTTMEVASNVDEADIGRVRTGAHATFTVDSFPGRRFAGEVRLIRQAPVTVNNVVTYVVMVRTKNPDLLLKPGMTATVSIDVETRKDVLLVPNAAIRFKPGGRGDEEKRDKASAAPSDAPGGAPADGKKNGGHSRKQEDSPALPPGRIDTNISTRPQKVWVQDPGDSTRLEPRKVFLGITDGQSTEVMRGDLKEGDKVITGSNEQGGDSSKGKSSSRMRFF